MLIIKELENDENYEILIKIYINDFSIIDIIKIFNKMDEINKLMSDKDENIIVMEEIIKLFNNIFVDNIYLEYDENELIKYFKISEDKFSEVKDLDLLSLNSEYSLLEPKDILEICFDYFDYLKHEKTLADEDINELENFKQINNFIETIGGLSELIGIRPSEILYKNKNNVSELRKFLVDIISISKHKENERRQLDGVNTNNNAKQMSLYSEDLMNASDEFEEAKILEKMGIQVKYYDDE